MEAEELKRVLEDHRLWLAGEGGSRANLQGADLQEANLRRANLHGADLADANLRGADLRDAKLRDANLQRANLQDAYLRGADLRGAYLWRADMQGAYLQGADLQDAYLRRANLQRANLRGADLQGADMWRANLQGADLQGADIESADLRRANLRGADLQGADMRGANLWCADMQGARGLVKLMGVMPGNYYWKRFGEGLRNRDYQFHVGLNCLRPGEVFNGDERLLCPYPGFYFASRSWCALHYPDRPLEALIRIPEDAQVNEPWATDGKASADKIEIIQVFDTRTGEDVTDRFRNPSDRSET